MTIVIPEDRDLEGFFKIATYTDSNEVVTTSGLDTYQSLPQKGFRSGYAVMYRASAASHAYVFFFTDTASQCFGYGGFASSTGITISGRPVGTTQLSDIGAFTSSGNLYLANLYIDNANERIVMSWDTTSGSPVLDCKAEFYVRKGKSV
jgi:hypothetical protein